MLGTLQNFVSSVSSFSSHHWQNGATTKVATSQPEKTKIDVEQLPKYTLAEVSEHWTTDDCWIVAFDRVYDITKFLDEHPGGQYIMLEHAGRDATLVFHGSRHSQEAYDMLDKYLIGTLVEEERLYLSVDIWQS